MLRGSHLGQDEIDFWSDLDVLVVLEPGLELNEEQLDQSIAAMGLPFSPLAAIKIDWLKPMMQN